MKGNNVDSISGTLVLAIPAREGLVFAADSLATVDGKSIPDRRKLNIVTSSKSTAFSITGTSTFIASPPNNVDLVSWAQEQAPLFSGADVVDRVLAKSGDSKVSEEILASAGGQLASGLTDYLADKRENLKTFIGREICRLVIAQYDSVASEYLIATVVLQVTSEGLIVLNGAEINYMGPEDERGIWKFGESEYVDANVLQPGSIGFPFLGPDIMRLWNGPKLIKDMTVKAATEIISLVISATERASKSVPINTAVGGEPMILLLNGESPRQLRAKRVRFD